MILSFAGIFSLMQGRYVRTQFNWIHNIDYMLPLVIYGSKRRLGTSVMLHVLEAVDSSEPVSPTGNIGTGVRSFRPFGEVRSLSILPHLFG